MIKKKDYEALKQRYGDVSSWAIWQRPSDSPRSNTDDLSVFCDHDLLSILNPKYVFVGLNASSTHGKRKDGEPPWRNFHSGYARQNDYKLRYALMNTRFWGGYITDIIKRYPEVDSSKVKAYLRKHPEIVELNVEEFKAELKLLGVKPILIAMGRAAYDILSDHLSGEYTTTMITHYSYTIGKEDYRRDVLSALRKF